MTSEALSTDNRLGLRAVEDAAHQALAVLADPAAPLLDAVVWVSAHLAAVHHVVNPELCRHLGADSVDEVVAGAVRLEHILRELEQQLAGDALAAHSDQAHLVQSLANELTAHVLAEGNLLSQLGERVSPEEQRRLIATFQRALAHGPTRPQPHAPHGRALGGLAFRFNGPRDRLMDTLDSRHVPTRRRSPFTVKPSPWGDYLLGASRTNSDADDE
jgi:hypothetical protein